MQLEARREADEWVQCALSRKVIMPEKLEIKRRSFSGRSREDRHSVVVTE
jgi:hypothetical protein